MNKKIFIVVISMSIFLASLVGMYSKSEYVHRMASYFAYPVIVLQSYTIDPMKQWFYTRGVISDLQKQNKLLQERHDQLNAEMISLRAQDRYWNDIKEVKTFAKKYEYAKGVVAHVLTRTFSDKNHFYLLDAGESKGIVKDMVVVYKHNLVGKVIEVYPWYSKVVLITDRSCKVASYCSQSNAHGIHEGNNNLEKTALQYVSHLDTVIDNDLVLSSGEGTVFPQGFALGIIERIHRNDLYNEISLKPLCDFRNLEYCIVIGKS